MSEYFMTKKEAEEAGKIEEFKNEAQRIAPTAMLCGRATNKDKADDKPVMVDSVFIAAIDLKALLIPEFQRDIAIGETKMNEIINNFNVQEAGVLDVSIIEGLAYLTDGFHRATGAIKNNFTKMVCQVRYESLAQAAIRFARQHDNTKLLTPKNKLDAECVAAENMDSSCWDIKTKAAYEVRNLCEKYNISETRADARQGQAFIGCLKSVVETEEKLSGSADWAFRVINESGYDVQSDGGFNSTLYLALSNLYAEKGMYRDFEKVTCEIIKYLESTGASELKALFLKQGVDKRRAATKLILGVVKNEKKRKRPSSKKKNVA